MYYDLMQFSRRIIENILLEQEELTNMSSWFIQEQQRFGIFGTLLLFLTKTAQDHSSIATFSVESAGLGSADDPPSFLQRPDDQRGDGGEVDGVLVHLPQRRRPAAGVGGAERVLAVGGRLPDDRHVRRVVLEPPHGQRVDGAVHDVERLDVPRAARGQRAPLGRRPAPAPLQRLDGGHGGRVVGQRQVGGDRGQPARVGAVAAGRRLERRHAEGRQVRVRAARRGLGADLLHGLGGQRSAGAGQDEEEEGDGDGDEARRHRCLLGLGGCVCWHVGLAVLPLCLEALDGF
jgi:hypothetical protein